MSEHGPEKGNILVVDDTPENLRVLTDSLSAAGYRVRPAPSGTMALEGARRFLPDLILLDIRMPEMDGFTVCRELKSDERLRDVPVIFISAMDETADKVKAFEVGGVDYVTKPFRFEEVLARVQTHIVIRRLQQEREAMIAELKEALSRVKQLSGMLPICASCKKIRDDKGYWNQIENYLHEHANAEFSHGICPECAKKLYPDLYESAFKE